jgi:hypothetical protein
MEVYDQADRTPGWFLRRLNMVAGTIQLGGKRFVIVPEVEYDRLRQRAAVTGDVDLPELPARLSNGNYPAIQAMRVELARKLIIRRVRPAGH